MTPFQFDRRKRGALPSWAGCLLLVGLVVLPGRGAAGSEEARFAFGVIADIQYADKETAGKRHYRASLGNLRACVDDFNGRDLAFTIQLGDLIDGNATPDRTASDLDRALGEYGRLSMPVYHVVGNHCLAADREHLRKKLKLDSFYYDFTLPAAEGWRFIVLDGNDAGYGVLGDRQLEWLASRLARARARREKVMVFNHFALLPDAAAHHRMEAPQPVLDLVNPSGCVVAYFAGHDHAGGYAWRDGIHHVTVKGMVEAPVHGAYAVMEVYPDRIMERGSGAEPSRELPFDGRALPAPVHAAP